MTVLRDAFLLWRRPHAVIETVGATAGVSRYSLRCLLFLAAVVFMEGAILEALGSWANADAQRLAGLAQAVVAGATLALSAAVVLTLLIVVAPPLLMAVSRWLFLGSGDLRGGRIACVLCALTHGAPPLVLLPLALIAAGLGWVSPQRAAQLYDWAQVPVLLFGTVIAGILAAEALRLRSVIDGLFATWIANGIALILGLSLWALLRVGLHEIGYTVAAA